MKYKCVYIQINGRNSNENINIHLGRSFFFFEKRNIAPAFDDLDCLSFQVGPVYSLYHFHYKVPLLNYLFSHLFICFSSIENSHHTRHDCLKPQNVS
jgi:hypothetical protein